MGILYRRDRCRSHPCPRSTHRPRNRVRISVIALQKERRIRIVSSFPHRIDSSSIRSDFFTPVLYLSWHVMIISYSGCRLNRCFGMLGRCFRWRWFPGYFIYKHRISTIRRWFVLYTRYTGCLETPIRDFIIRTSTYLTVSKTYELTLSRVANTHRFDLGERRSQARMKIRFVVLIG